MKKNSLPIKIKDAVAQVSSKEIYEIPGKGLRLGFMDFGAKANILRNFQKRDCHLVVFPWNTSAEKIMEYHLDGVFLSNGPGDPADLQNVITEIKSLIAHKMPIIGICLGNQLTAWALGGTTKKMKFGHRGGNHPVKDLDHNRIYITSQNHGYAIDKIPEIARVATKLAMGYLLDEVLNEVTGKTYACFEPSLDYIVVKIPKWPFDKFKKADRRLGTKMMASGEIMAIGENF